METKNRWIAGSDLLPRLNRQELFDAVKSGKLTPYDHNGKKIVDEETLLVSIPHKKKKGFTSWRMPTDKELDKNLSWQDSKPAFLSMENITSFQYSENQIQAMLEPSPVLVESPVDYITRRREEGANNEIIAFELHDGVGKFVLSYLELARLLGLDKGIQATQVDTIKQRGRRACEKGKHLVSCHGVTKA